MDANSKRVHHEKVKYLPRQQMVEHPFGTIKRQWGFDHVLLKGLKKNFFFDIMNNLMMRKMNSKLLDDIAAGHKKYIETGEIVNKKTVLELDKVIYLN